MRPAPRGTGMVACKRVRDRPGGPFNEAGPVPPHPEHRSARAAIVTSPAAKARGRGPCKTLQEGDACDARRIAARAVVGGDA